MNSENNLPFSWSSELKKESSLASYSSLADGKSHIVGAFVKIDSKNVFTTGGAFNIKMKLLHLLG